jgi:Protein of unknown function (DUF2637)
VKHHGNGIWEVRRPWQPLLDALHDRPAKRPARKAEKATGDAPSRPAPRAPEGILRIARAVALWAITIVIAAASAASFAESYRGLYVWALRHGLSGFWAAAFPLQVDSFIGVGELVLFVATVDRWKLRHRAGAWVVALLGLAVSVAGNIGHVAAHDAQSRGTAAVPPVAAFAALWLGLAVLKRVLERAHEDRAELVAPAPTEPPAPLVPEVIAPEVAGTSYEAAKAAYVASVRGGNPITERGLADRFGISRGDARKIRAEVVTTANGHPEDVPDSTVP